MRNSRTIYFSHSCLFILLVLATSLAQLPALNLENYSPSVRAQINNFYQQAKANPRDAEKIGKLGMALLAYNEHLAAAECFARAHAIAPQEMRWVYYAAHTQIALNNQAQAILFLRETLAINANYVPAKIQLANILLLTNQSNEAANLYEAATKIAPTAQWAWYGLGRAQSAQKNFTAAIYSFEKAITLSPQFGIAHYALAMAMRDAGRVGKAKEHLALYQQYRNIRPASGDELMNEIAALNLSANEFLQQGITVAAEGKLTEAIIAHEKALEIKPDFLQAHLNLIQLYGQLRQFAQAEKHFRAALQINPTIAEAHYNFGVILLSQQKLSDAKIAFTNALLSNPQYAEADFNLGILFLQEANIAEAENHFRATLKNNPNFRAAHFELGRVLVQQENYAEAIAHFQQIILPEDQNSPRYVYALAATQIRAGERTEGLQTLQRAQSLAAKYEQKELLASIARDLKILGEGQ